MKTLHFPSVEHAARQWRPDPHLISEALLGIFDNPPSFNYSPLLSAVRDLLLLKVPYEEVRLGIEKAVKRDAVRKNFLEVLPLIRNHFDAVHPDFVNAVSERQYPLGRDLRIPVRAPLVYGVGGQLYLPWFVFWRVNALRGEKLSLFAAIVRDVIRQDPDLEAAKFMILDFSAPTARSCRTLRIIDAHEIPTISETRKAAMIQNVVEGFAMARAEISRRADRQRPNQASESAYDDPNQPAFL